MKKPRECPICISIKKERLYRQCFSEFSDGGLFNGYDVVICKNCGFGFADKIPDQDEFDRYYKQMSKYENEHISGHVSESARSTYKSIVKTVESFLLDRNARILDVGCATGALLAEFKVNGYHNLIGADPSPACAQTAMKLYGVEVLTTPISEISYSEEQFDFLILNSVLEHIRDLNSSLQSLRSLMKIGGMIWIEVPDVTGFSKMNSVAFQQFSMEHINYFSALSLENLMRKNGFEPVGIWHNKRQLEAVIDPALSTIFRKVDKIPDAFVPKMDNETKSSLLSYIENSYQVDENVQSIIKMIAKDGRGIIVWGAGTHTQRLLASSLLAEAKIIAIVDTNQRYHGKKLKGIPIISPQQLSDRKEPILISSRLYQEEIARKIQIELNMPNKIIRLY